MNYVNLTKTIIKGGVSVCTFIQDSGQISPGSFKSKYCTKFHPKTGSWTKNDCTIWGSLIKKS